MAGAIPTYLSNIAKVLGVGAAFASLPFFASLTSLQPPWPPAIGFVSTALVLLASLVIWEWTRNSRVHNRRRLIAIAASLTIVGLMAYLIMYSLFVEEVSGSDARVIRGYECTRAAAMVYPEDCPDLPPDALPGAEWDSAQLWTRSSITAVRLALTISWLLFTAGLIGAVGAVVAGRRF